MRFSGTATVAVNPLTQKERASGPTTKADTGHWYTKDVAGVTEAFFRDSSGNEIQLTSGGMAGGVGAGAQYLVLAASGSLSAERVFTAGSGISVVDSGAGAAYTVTNTLLVGAAGGQVIIGGTANGESITVRATAGTVGPIIFEGTSGTEYGRWISGPALLVNTTAVITTGDNFAIECPTANSRSGFTVRKNVAGTLSEATFVLSSNAANLTIGVTSSTFTAVNAHLQDCAYLEAGAANNGIVFSAGNAPLYFYTNASEAIRILSDQTIWIGGAAETTELVAIRKDHNAGTFVRINNRTNGTGAYTGIVLSQDNSYAGQLVQYSLGYATVARQGVTSLYAGGTGGLWLESGLTGPITLFINGAESARLTDDGTSAEFRLTGSATAGSSGVGIYTAFNGATEVGRLGWQRAGADTTADFIVATAIAGTLTMKAGMTNDGQWFVVDNATVPGAAAGRSALFYRSTDAEHYFHLQNASAGASARVDTFYQADTATGAIGVTSSTFNALAYFPANSMFMSTGGAGGLAIGTTVAAPITFFTGTSQTNRMWVSAAGNLLVGSNSVDISEASGIQQWERNQNSLTTTYLVNRTNGTGALAIHQIIVEPAGAAEKWAYYGVASDGYTGGGSGPLQAGAAFLTGNGDCTQLSLGLTVAKPIIFYINNAEVGRISSGGTPIFGGGGIPVTAALAQEAMLLFDSAPDSPALICDGNNGALNNVTGAVTDGYSAGVRMDPEYRAAGAQTVSRHNYLDLRNAVVSNVTITDGAIIRLDAALGTHIATTADDKTANAKDGTLQVNVNGTIKHIQLYAD